MGNEVYAYIVFGEIIIAAIIGIALLLRYGAHHKAQLEKMEQKEQVTQAWVDAHRYLERFILSGASLSDPQSKKFLKDEIEAYWELLGTYPHIKDHGHLKFLMDLRADHTPKNPKKQTRHLHLV